MILLDTHVLLWWFFNDPHLTPGIASLITSSDDVAVSAVSGFEIVTKQAIGKLEAPDDLEAQVERSGFTEIPVTLRHGVEAGRLPSHHKDPFDRLLIAQARCEGLTLVTADRAMSAYDVPILPAG
ncbi:type II toxin-antitoxin system VapC family toxin [Kibdelosporangium phytohabitans]|uniref:Twitching motility protein PilT n=1 Tax=Kibdelosporangium phytohabitans TaxID=860235 RepID=A0A0N7F515_9PSEU|nr:type II toxin-antitoxin system VapC family toxin [Kibdelosporangium phytohabitans]ALG12967.1 twitching motility protein PilT [Kibdelosporangium phytohabitans]MBE1464684.1 PIN domain nuclease of toxin-antitoxin system [Kibdelosporangium phytohabitans]